MSIDSFKRRMSKLTPYGTVGNRLNIITDDVEEKTFSNDRNYREGMIYDWNMNPLEMTDFKFEKRKTHTAEGSAVEYHVRFRPGYNPEERFRDLYHREDGRDRLGFYIDVYDYHKDVYDKYLIVGKDDRVNLDRYNVFKCNWQFEWVYDGEYHTALGCIRSAADSSFSTGDSDKLGGTTVEGELSTLFPTSKLAETVLLGQRFIISDDVINPQTYSVVEIDNISMLGVTKCYLKAHEYNPHTDYVGLVNDEEDVEFSFETPIPALLHGFGEDYHSICDCVSKRYPLNRDWSDAVLICGESKIRIDGAEATIKASEFDDGFYWEYVIEGETYTVEDLSKYFEITEVDDYVKVRAVSKVMAKYVLRVNLCHQEVLDPLSYVELEVVL